MLARKMLRDLATWRAQILAIALIVTCGVATLVSMQSVYESLQLTQRLYYERHRFADVFASLTRAPEPVAGRLREIPGVADVQTRVVADVTLDMPGRNEATGARLISLPDNRAGALNGLFMRSGHYPEASAGNEVVVSEAFASANALRLGSRLTAVVNRRRWDLRVSGIALSPEYVYEIRAGDFLPDSAHFGVMWMDRKQLAAAFDMTGSFNDVALALGPGAGEKAVLESVDRILMPYGGLGAYAARDQRSNRTISDELGQLRAEAFLIPLIFLGVAAFLLNVAMSRLVATQREQIAILKALGFSDATVTRHYMASAAVVMAIGAACGLALGAWLGWRLTIIYTGFFHFPILEYRISAPVIFTALGVTSLAAGAGAFTSLRRVMRLAPAEAMRPPSPAAYRPTIVERLNLAARLSPASRMLLRNFERKPIVSIVTALAIALAAAILVLGRYGIDAVTFLMNAQFVQGMRQDATVTFSRPLSSAARFDLPSLPGVMEAEWFRSVPVRLRFGASSRYVALMGVSGEGDLHRILDNRLRVHRVPLEGLLVSSALARILRARPGDSLSVEVLEGRREQRRIPIAAVIDDMLGLQAYMSLASLHRLLNEGATVSGAYIRLDAAQRTAFDRRIKRMPTVGSVAYRAATFAQFNRMLGETMYISIAFLIGFACAIAVGVIYNAGRVALSERARELATLRIMGFSRAEIAQLFVGEQLIVTGFAIPLGWALGYGLCALMSPVYQTDLYRIPLFVQPSTYVFSGVVVLGAALASLAVLTYSLNRLDLLAVLKGAG